MSINDLNLRDEVTDEVPSELPEQMGGQALPTLLPGINVFRVPSSIAQCIEAFDEQQKAPDGSVIMRPATAAELAANPAATMVPSVLQRLRVKFDKENPLIVVGGPNDGTPVATSISNVPRNRARKGEPPQKVADMTYWLRTSMGDTASPLSTPKQWLAAILQTAGKTFRVEHGLTAQCREDKVRYINDPTDPSGRGSIQDPSNQMGCGKRHYTKDFRLPAASVAPGQNPFSDMMYCSCGAKLRGFFQIEKFLPPTAGQ